MLIAIVDDDSSMQCLLQAALEHAGHQVRLFPDAHSFLDPGCNPDLGMLVVDWLLPDMQGPELVRAARQHYGAQLPILFATQRQQERDLVQALEAGADDFMSKPLQLPVFMARVQALLRRSYRANSAPSVSPSRGGNTPSPSTCSATPASWSPASNCTSCSGKASRRWKPARWTPTSPSCATSCSWASAMTPNTPAGSPCKWSMAPATAWNGCKHGRIGRHTGTAPRPGCPGRRTPPFHPLRTA